MAPIQSHAKRSVPNCMSAIGQIGKRVAVVWDTTLTIAIVWSTDTYKFSASKRVHIFDLCNLSSPDETAFNARYQSSFFLISHIHTFCHSAFALILEKKTSKVFIIITCSKIRIDSRADSIDVNAPMHEVLQENGKYQRHVSFCCLISQALRLQWYGIVRHKIWSAFPLHKTEIKALSWT